MQASFTHGDKKMRDLDLAKLPAQYLPKHFCSLSSMDGLRPPQGPHEGVSMTEPTKSQRQERRQPLERKSRSKQSCIWQEAERRSASKPLISVSEVFTWR